MMSPDRHVRQGAVKIIYVIGTLDVGGAEGQLVDLATRLDRARFSPVVVCLSAGGILIERLRAHGVPVEVVGFRAGPSLCGPAALRRSLLLLPNFVRLVRVFRREAPDLVHGVLFSAYVLGAFAARLAGVPAVVAGRRSLAHFKAGKPHYPLLERLANRMTDLMIANSVAVRRDVLRMEGLSADRVIVIHNGLEPAQFAVGPDERLRRTLGLEGRRPVVAVVANFIHYKGHRYFFPAWAQVARDFPAGMALLIGDGPLRTECESMAVSLGVGSAVRFLGTRHDVPALLALADLLVHPSVEEGFSNAILEAMAAGKPVLAANVGGNPEAVVDGETGLLVPPRDSGALAAAMVRLFRDPAEARRFGQAGRRRVVEHFMISSSVRQYEAVYERLVASKARQRVPGNSEEWTARVH